MEKKKEKHNLLYLFHPNGTEGMLSRLNTKTVFVHKWDITLIVHQNVNTNKRILRIFYVAFSLYIQPKLQTVVFTRHGSFQGCDAILPRVKSETLAESGGCKRGKVLSSTQQAIV